MIKSFRGLIADGSQDTIVLHTNDGSTGYRIVKFQLIHTEPGEANVEHTVKIYTESQDLFNNTIDFSDNTLLGASYYTGGSTSYGGFITIIFDNQIFNQDIYITHSDLGGNSAVNYYIELEQIKLDLGENTVAAARIPLG